MLTWGLTLVLGVIAITAIQVAVYYYLVRDGDTARHAEPDAGAPEPALEDRDLGRRDRSDPDRERRRCPECGTPNEATPVYSFCRECGAKL